MESNAKPAGRTAERSRLRFWALVFLLGPLPVCGAFTLLILKLIPNEIGPVATCGFFGALWGLASGVRSRTLLRAILGLNGGLLIGSAAGMIIEGSGPGQRLFASIVVSVSMGALTGLLRICPPDRVWSFCKGTAVGFFALIVMSGTFFFLLELFKSRFGQSPTIMACGFIASALGVAILLRGTRDETSVPTQSTDTRGVADAQTNCPADRSSSNT